jgi:uncharacterized membrane protein
MYNKKRMNSMFPYFKAAAILVLVDLFWLSTAGIFFRQMVERIQGQPSSFRYVSAIIVYAALAYLLLDTTSYQQAFFRGLAVYAVFDFTNLAVFERYDWKMAVADSIWGGVLFVSARYLIKNVF